MYEIQIKSTRAFYVDEYIQYKRIDCKKYSSKAKQSKEGKGPEKRDTIYKLKKVNKKRSCVNS